MVDDASERRRGAARRGRGRRRALPAPRAPGRRGRGAQRRARRREPRAGRAASTPTACRARAGWTRCCRTSPTPNSTRSRRESSRSTRRWRRVRGGRARQRRARGVARARPRRAIARYEAARSPLDRGPAPARVIPYGRVPFVPGAAIVVRRHLRFDETLTRGGEDVEFVLARAVRALRARGAGRARPPDRPARMARAPRLLRQDRRPHRQAPSRQGAAAARLAVDDRGVGRARRAKRRSTAVAITAAATALLARELAADAPPRELAAARHAAVRPRRRRRAHPPLVAARARCLAIPRTRLPLAAALLADPLQAPRRPRVRRRPVARLPAAPHAGPAAAREAVAACAPTPLSDTRTTCGGRRSKWVVIAAWLLAALVALPFQSKLQALASDESDAFQDRDAESTRVDEHRSTRASRAATRRPR